MAESGSAYIAAMSYTNISCSFGTKKKIKDYMASCGWASYEEALLGMLEQCQGQRQPNRGEAPAEAAAEGQDNDSRDQPLSYAKLSENAEAMTYFTGLRNGALEWLFSRLVSKVLRQVELLFVFVQFCLGCASPLRCRRR